VKLIVGLGNPGREYRDTRHNIGFLVVDELARRCKIKFSLGPSKVPDVMVAKHHGSWPCLIAKPLTFMNSSGEAVAALANYYDVIASELLVIVDETALPFGKLKARARGSAGGHNGLQSIIDRLDTNKFSRLRLGVGRGDTRRDLADHVLSTFEADERIELDSFIALAADAAELFTVQGIEVVMNRYNRTVVDLEID
jgi:PTH1 family peptidyl-tRNA hydrolase